MASNRLEKLANARVDLDKLVGEFHAVFIGWLTATAEEDYLKVVSSAMLSWREPGVLEKRTSGQSEHSIRGYVCASKCREGTFSAPLHLRGEQGEVLQSYRRGLDRQLFSGANRVV